MTDPRLHLQALADALPADGTATVPVAWLRAVLAGNGAPAPDPAERMLDANEVAPMLGTTVRWVYNHADQLGGKRLSSRCLRFPESAIRRRMDRRQ